MKNKDRLQKINSRTLSTSIRRLKSLVPLVIAGDNVSEDEYDIEPNETFLVGSLSKSHVKFNDNRIFDDHDVAVGGMYTWTPKKDETGTAYYHTEPISGKAATFTTHSIKVGSGT
jgi:hypothetical protein